MEALAFLKSATPEQAMAALAPGMCAVGMETCAPGRSPPTRTLTGHDGRVTLAMAETVRRMLASFDPAIASATIDLAGTFTDKYLPA